MKSILAVFAVVACLGAPTLANAGLHISVPHGRHHHHLLDLHRRQEAASAPVQAAPAAPAPPAPQGW